MTMDHSGHKASDTATSDYTCPMHPEVKSTTPGSCPKCGMTLVPMAASGEKAR